MTIAEIVPLWAEQKRKFVKQSSMASYSILIVNYVLPELGNKELTEISFDFMQDFIVGLLDKGLKKRSAGDVFICIKMIMTYAVERHGAPFIKYRINWPTAAIEPKKELQVYTPNEQRAIITYVTEHLTYTRLAVLITICTGMRIGEICALRWENVDVENKCIHIRETLSRVYDVDLSGACEKGKTKIVFSEPKTTGSYRDVPLTRDLLAILKNYKKIANPQYFVATGTERFTEPRTFRMAYKKLILEEVKLNRIIHFHGLRHTFASRLVSSGVDVKTASRILGHADISTTLNLYVHPTMDNKLEAVNKSLKGLFK